MSVPYKPESSCYSVIDLFFKLSICFLALILLASGSSTAWSTEQVLESRCWIRTGQNVTGNAFCRWPLFNRGMWYVKDRKFCGDWKSYSCLKQVALSPSLVALWKIELQLDVSHLSKCMCVPLGSHFLYIGSYYSISYRYSPKGSLSVKAFRFYVVQNHALPVVTALLD